MRRLLPILVILAAAIHFYRVPQRAAELEVVPDSVEYAVAGHRFATTGRYEIQVNGKLLPPRYTPGFSVLFLAPIYRLAPGEIGNGIFAVWTMAIVMALFSYLLGNKLAGPWGGVLSTVILLHHPQIALYTQLIMTDIPAVALGLLACWIYLRSLERRSPWLYLSAGVVIAVSVAIRPLSGFLLFPFLVDVIVRRSETTGLLLPRPVLREREPEGRIAKSDCPSKRWVYLLALCLPVAAVIFATSLQQKITLGNWHRTGYQLWLPVPYDYVHLVFSTRYIRDNLGLIHWNLIYLPIVGGAIGAIALLSKRSPHARPLIAFLLLGAAPISAIHLCYFFMDIRFHFLTLGLLCIAAGGGLAVLMPLAMRNRFKMVLPILALTILFPRLPAYPLTEEAPIRDRVATAAARLLPTNAVFISAIDPAYLEQRLARGTDRRILPIDRDTPYAQAWLAWRRIERLDPPPRNAADQACAGLGRGGATQLYTFTANEEGPTISKWIDIGIPVYMDLLSTRPDRPSREALERAFALSPVSPETPWLVQLTRIARRNSLN